MPPHVHFSIYNELGTLPHFDGSENPPSSVTDFLQQVSDADGIVICQPEYAFGVAGTLKNALDWTVGNGTFSGKPVVYITAASSGEHAHASLAKTLQAIDTRIPDGGALLISAIRAKLDADGKFKDPAESAKVQAVVDRLLDVIT